MAIVNLKGQPCHTIGELPAMGLKAPDFKLTANDFSEKSLRDFRGKKKVINIVQSFDTSIGATSARKFNEAVSKRDDTVLLNVSSDLPFAATRFCESAGLPGIITLSTFRAPSFGKEWGVRLIDGAAAGLTARAVVVLDAQDRVVYTQLVPEISQEPDYNRALSVLSSS